MSIPKQKRPKSRRKTQRSQYVRNVQKDLLNRVQLVACSNCGEKKRSHTICAECGAHKLVKKTEKKEEIKGEKVVKETKKISAKKKNVKKEK